MELKRAVGIKRRQRLSEAALSKLEAGEFENTTADEVS